MSRAQGCAGATQLKTPYRDGTTHVIFELLDFSRSRHPASRGIGASLHVIARLAVLVPRPRVNLTCLLGVFAPNSKYRALVTPAKRGRGGQRGTREAIAVLLGPVVRALLSGEDFQGSWKAPGPWR